MFIHEWKLRLLLPGNEHSRGIIIQAIRQNNTARHYEEAKRKYPELFSQGPRK